MTQPDPEFRGELVLYQTTDGTVELDVRLEHESLWLSQRQIGVLFAKDTDTIGLHLRNVFAEGELDESATTEDCSVVQREGNRNVRRTVRFYNLDAILSVGYRVNSRQGTQFRIWATGVLRDHLVKGYTVNRNRLRELNQAVRLIADTARRRDLSGDEAQALLAVVGQYSRARSSRPSAAATSIRGWKRRRPISSTSWSRTMPSSTETSGSPRRSSSGSSTVTERCTTPAALRSSPMRRSSP